eukprot:COSAG01_NODE_5454_length_4255_cov_3.187199_3_plen_999_part_00
MRTTANQRIWLRSPLVGPVCTACIMTVTCAVVLAVSMYAAEIFGGDFSQQQPDEHSTAGRLHFPLLPESDDDGATSYVPLPSAPPLSMLPVLELPELNRGQILQLWGHSQAAALRNTAVPATLKEAYAFDMVIMLSLDAHNSMESSKKDHQQGNKSDVLTVTEFSAGVEAFTLANYSVIFYTSIMHDGHRSDWENGSLTLSHPEMVQRDEHGGCPALYGQCNLSPSSATEFTLNNTIADIMTFPKAIKAVMLDNAFWQTSTFGPTGFETAAVTNFRTYINQRFGQRAGRSPFFGELAIAPPNASQRSSTTNTDAERALFNVWKVWREREYAHAVERYRERLHPLGVAVLANTDFWPTTWTRGDCQLFGHVDAVVSESHATSASNMALKYSLGLALTPGRPNLNYIAVFANKPAAGEQAPMVTQETMRGMVVPSFTAMSRPWLVAWSLTSLIDAPTTPAQTATAAELSSLMLFRSAHFQLYNFAGANDKHANHHAALVGVLTDWQRGNILLPNISSESRCLTCLLGPVKRLRSIGVDYRFETAKTIALGSLLRPSTSLKILLCDADVSSLDVGTAAAIGEWVRTGGILWSTRGCASIDELGRPYEQPLLQADIAKNGIGKGNATFLDESLETNGAFMKAVLGMAQIIQPRTPVADTMSSHQNTSNASCPASLPYPYGTRNEQFCCSVKPSTNGMDCPSSVLCCLAAKSCEGNIKCAEYHPTPGTTSWQTTSWYSDEAGLVVHFENVSDTGGMSLFGTLELQLVLPHSMLARESDLTARMLSPYESKPRTITIQRTSATVNVTVPTPPAYGVIAISSTMKTDDSIVSTGAIRRTPPLGWTSWATIGCSIDCKKNPDYCLSERVLKQMMDAVVDGGWKAAGYTMLHVDDCAFTVRNAHGELVADPTRFTNGSFESLATYAHSRGLLLGAYLDMGNHTCDWGHQPPPKSDGEFPYGPGSYSHEAADIGTLSSWGVNQVKGGGNCQVWSRYLVGVRGYDVHGA